jgi:hypothetical protein
LVLPLQKFSGKKSQLFGKSLYHKTINTFLMKKNFLALLMLTAMFWACKPRTQELRPQTTNSQQVQVQNNLILASQEWFKTVQNNYKKNASINRDVNLRDLPWIPIWDKAKFYPFSEEETLILVPVYRYSKVSYSQDFGFERRLKIVVNHTKQTMTGVIAEMLMEKNTLKTYQDDMFYYAHTQMLQGNQGKFVYYELAVDHPLYLSTSVDPTQRGVECAGDEHPTKLFTIYVTLADVCMVFYTDGCTQWVEFEDCGGQGGGGGLNPVNNPPMVVTIPTIPPLNFPGMMPPLIPINSPISLPPIPSPTPWLPWLSYPILGGGDTGGIGSGDLPVDPGSNTNPADFSPATYDYHGVNIDSYYLDKTNTVRVPEEKTLKIVKFIIDDPDFRKMIKAYLGTNRKIHIVWTPFKNTPKDAAGQWVTDGNLMYIDPKSIEKFSAIVLANTVIHEGGHAMYDAPDGDLDLELYEVKSWFEGDIPAQENVNQVEHNGMAMYHRNKAAAILERFDKSPLGSNNPTLKKEHYMAMFLMNLLYGPDVYVGGMTSLLDIKFFNALPSDVQDDYRLKYEEIKKIYKP